MDPFSLFHPGNPCGIQDSNLGQNPPWGFRGQNPLPRPASWAKNPHQSRRTMRNKNGEFRNSECTRRRACLTEVKQTVCSLRLTAKGMFGLCSQRLRPERMLRSTWIDSSGKINARVDYALRGWDSNPRPSGYEPDGLPNCPTLHCMVKYTTPSCECQDPQFPVSP